ncbi:MAG: radical SAM protein [Acidobacteria bacterium]|nr:radical SAM protein [Acidobacteriota bacterium]
MQASIFNLRVPFPERDEVFLMNTLTDAQMVVSSDVAALLDRSVEPQMLDDEARAAFDELVENGFLVESRQADRHALDRYFVDVREDTREMKVTVLTTLQCNFACDYCFQGDHDEFNKTAAKMSLATASRIAAWIDQKLDEVQPESLVLTFFGGEPLLNLPVVYFLAERVHALSTTRGIPLHIALITNGLLLTSEVVDRLTPYGLYGVKVTLDGDRDTHDRMRPLRGGQGTFDRIINNVRQVASKCRITIGGNFDESSVDSYPALLDFLKEQEFADKLAKVNFKPIIKTQPASPKGAIPLTPVGGDKPLNGTCQTSAGAGRSSSPCDSCHFVDEKMAFLRQETKKRGFPTGDGVHMGPCEIHRRHAYTIGPEGSLYACPGFTGELGLAVGHIERPPTSLQTRAADRFDDLGAWRNCGDCSYIPVCAGGCSVASQSELGDMNVPACHKPSMESALLSLAADAVGAC